jgi:hypothetical protein
MDDSIFSLLSHLLARETPQPHSSSSSSSLREQRLCFQHRIGSHFKSARRYQSSYLGLCWHLLPYICTRIIHTWTVTSESTGAHNGHRLLPFPSFLFLLALYGRTRRSKASKSSDRLPFLLIHTSPLIPPPLMRPILASPSHGTTRRKEPDSAGSNEPALHLVRPHLI